MIDAGAHLTTGVAAERRVGLAGDLRVIAPRGAVGFRFLGAVEAVEAILRLVLSMSVTVAARLKDPLITSPSKTG